MQGYSLMTVAGTVSASTELPSLIKAFIIILSKKYYNTICFILQEYSTCKFFCDESEK